MSSGRFFVDDPSADPLTPAEVAQAEDALGVRLPTAYAELLAEQDGGEPARCCFPTDFPMSWADDHFLMDQLLGVRSGQLTLLDSRYLVAEWGYPDLGLLIGYTPTAGHEVVMLDYTACGPQGEPAVVYVEEAPGGWATHRVADTFQTFLDQLTDEPGSSWPRRPLPADDRPSVFHRHPVSSATSRFRHRATTEMSTRSETSRNLWTATGPGDSRRGETSPAVDFEHLIESSWEVSWTSCWRCSTTSRPTIWTA